MASITDWASSVTITKPISVFSSIRSKRAPAASFTQPIFCLVASGVAFVAASGPAVPARRFTLMLTISA